MAVSANKSAGKPAAKAMEKAHSNAAFKRMGEMMKGPRFTKGTRKGKK